VQTLFSAPWWYGVGSQLPEFFTQFFVRQFLNIFAMNFVFGLVRLPSRSACVFCLAAFL